MVREQIEGAHRAYADALARHDAAALAACYDADAVILAPNAQPVAGPVAIRAYCEGFCALPYDFRLEGFRVEHVLSACDYVIEVSRYRSENRPVGDPAARIVTNSKCLMVWRYRSGRWLIARQMYG